MRTVYGVIMPSNQKPMEITKFQRLNGGNKANATKKRGAWRKSNNERKILRGTVRCFETSHDWEKLGEFCLSHLGGTALTLPLPLPAISAAPCPAPQPAPRGVSRVTLVKEHLSAWVCSQPAFVSS